jgi:signal transduction histidine kinase
VQTRTAARIAWSFWGLAVVFTVCGAVLWALPAPVGLLTVPAALVARSATLVAPTMGALVVTRHPRNPVGWLLLGYGVVGAFVNWAYDYSLYPISGANPSPFNALPAQQAVIQFATGAQGFAWTFIPFIFLLFPDGRLPSPRWRPVAALTLVTFLFLNVVVAATTHGPSFGATQPVELSVADYYGATVIGALTRYGYWMAVALLALAPLSMVVRFRRARGDERLQLKWACLGALLFVTNTVVLVAVAHNLLAGHPLAVTAVNYVAFPVLLGGFPVSLGVAILKYRLYDIDIVLNKALVYGSLAALITTVYVAIVVGLGGALGAGGEPNLALSILATAVVAVGFQPARERLQRLANRLVYGQRATPYEVMADFARRMAGALSSEEVLPRMAEAAARGVGAARSRVSVLLPGTREHSVAWPPGSSAETFDRTATALHGGERVGEISVAKAPGDRLTPAEEKLLEDLASQAGPALRNAGLMAELRDSLAAISVQAVELEASRRRIVATQDEERRRMERDLHDGAQQQLVSLSGQLRLLQRVMARDPVRAEGLLAELVVEADEALEAVRDLGRGIFPPVLADKGLAAALTARVTKHFPRGRLEWPPELAGARFDPGVEAAVYFCCLEALQNVARHAGEVPVTVELAVAGDALVFSVTDSGPGFDPASASPGMGQQNMADRLAALGGSLEIHSTPGEGTTVRGEIPLGLPAASTSGPTRPQPTPGPAVRA